MLIPWRDYISPKVYSGFCTKLSQLAKLLLAKDIYTFEK